MFGKNHHCMILEGEYAVTPKEIQEYLKEVKNLIRNDKYRIALNENRRDNRDLFLEYIIPEERAKEILLGLTYMDFCKKVQNSKPGREDEWLYIFGKEETFISKYGDGEEKVQLYIKINKIEEKFVAVISFHKQKYKLKYYFK